MKTISKKTAKRKAWVVFSKFIRTRDCLKTTGSKQKGKCFTCGKLCDFKDLQAGHFIAGRHNANLFSERGTHAQCRQCNLFKSGNQLEYRRRLIEEYGEGVDVALEYEAQQTVRYTAQDYELIEKHYKEKTKRREW